MKILPFFFVNSCMKDLRNIKQQILTDDKVANAVEYLLSKVILDKPLPKLWFIYKKHKIVLGKNGLYSIYNPNGQKIANKIHFQEVAKYIIDNQKNISKNIYIREVEAEMFRFKEKIEYFTNYNRKLKLQRLDAKIDAMWDFYYNKKASLMAILRENKIYC